MNKTRVHVLLCFSSVDGLQKVERSRFRSLLAGCATILASFWLTSSIAARAQDSPRPTVAELQAKVDRVLSKVTPAVVGIKKDGSFQGSGIIVSEDGIVLMHGHHAFNISDPISIVLADGRTVSARIGSWTKTPLYDFSILRIEDKGRWPHVELGAIDQLHRGVWCMHVGHPGGIQAGRPPVPRMGFIVEVADFALSSSCMIAPGDSGAPLFDEQGRVIGTCIGLNSLDRNAAANYTSAKTLRRGIDEFLDLEAKSQSLLNARIERLQSIPPWQTAWNSIRDATVQVNCDGQQGALGIAVDPRGLIVTKLSQLFGEVSCTLSDGRTVPAKIAACSPAFDLVLLQVNLNGLPTISWDKSGQPQNGTVVVVLSPRTRPIAVGIICDSRTQKIPDKPARLSVDTKPIGAAMLVTGFPPGSYASDFLRAGDIITKVEGHSVHTPDDVLKLIASAGKDGGDRVAVAYEHKGTALTANVPLNSQVKGGEFWRLDLSDRRSGFPSVFIHDAVIGPADCGGAVVDGQGHVIGMNIARADRDQTLAIPAAIIAREVRTLIQDVNVGSDGTRK